MSQDATASGGRFRSGCPPSRGWTHVHHRRAAAPRGGRFTIHASPVPRASRAVRPTHSPAHHPTIHIRDSKNKEAARLEFTDSAWSEFLEFTVGH
ncbi:DUF397 domain-containing protein [Streptomyces afghaniensis]|uniref:DUF397 domain-containing protein n=1 Tax=Streptomyces afghaniensis TaxID=66865 RepID=UPI0027D8725D|nr:DUF397 domain-containing protein [Streptomyces afghaniensis]